MCHTVNSLILKLVGTGTSMYKYILSFDRNYCKGYMSVAGCWTRP